MYLHVPVVNQPLMACRPVAAMVKVELKGLHLLAPQTVNQTHAEALQATADEDGHHLHR